MILKGDQQNTSDYILVADLLLKDQDSRGREEGKEQEQEEGNKRVKLVNVYFQPDNKQEVEERLMATLHRIRQAEPETKIILGGDFNQRLMDTENPLNRGITNCNMKICSYDRESFHRSQEDGSEKRS